MIFLGINWYHTTLEARHEASYNQMSLQPGSTLALALFVYSKEFLGGF